MPKVERTVLIDAPRDRVFAVVTDYERYPDFLPEMRHVQVMSHQDGVTVARFELELIMRVSYTLRLVEEAPNTLRWSLQDAKMMSLNDGAWTLEALSDTQTRATYGLDIKLRGLIPKSVSTRLMGTTLPQTLERFKKQAERM